MSALGLLLVGAAAAGIGSPATLAGAGAVLLAGSSGFVVGVHRLGRPSHGERLEARLRYRPLQVLARTAEAATRYRVSWPGGAAVLAYSTLNWLLDAGVLVLAFVLLGLAVPWHVLLFAYAASQIAAGLSFLPAGLGALEAGLVGGFLLMGMNAGTALAATLMFRVVAYWAVAAVGAVIFVAQTRQRRAGPPGGARSR
ncbi:MAG: flippase-like domain-containing protein [Acidimicrobiales bacterium]|nr:flippase-like domain-containing protein [Acidimicrobiales bacterium]